MQPRIFVLLSFDFILFFVVVFCFGGRRVSGILTSAQTSSAAALKFGRVIASVDMMLPTGPSRCAAPCRLLALVAAAAVLLMFAAAASGCPHKCSCSGSHVDCQGLGLKTVPKGIPRNAERL